MEDRWAKFIEELEEIESNLEKASVSALNDWRSRVADSLDGNWKVRFEKISFYEHVANDFYDDIPF